MKYKLSWHRKSYIEITSTGVFYLLPSLVDKNRKEYIYSFEKAKVETTWTYFWLFWKFEFENVRAYKNENN